MGTELQSAVDAELAKRDLANALEAIVDLRRQVGVLRADVARLDADLDDLTGRTSLLSPSRLTRVFTVWGHYFLAQIIIGVVVGGVVVLVAMLAATH